MGDYIRDVTMHAKIQVISSLGMLQQMHRVPKKEATYIF